MNLIQGTHFSLFIRRPHLKTTGFSISRNNPCLLPPTCLETKMQDPPPPLAEFDSKKELLLPMEKAPLRPEMLVLAREEIGMTQKSLAETLGITQGTLSKLEAGLMGSTPELEQNLAKTRTKPLRFFLYQRPIEAPTFYLYRDRVSISANGHRRFWTC